MVKEEQKLSRTGTQVPFEKEETSQLDNIIGLVRRNDEVYIHNAGRSWATWDHYPIFARIQEGAHATFFQKKE